MSGFTDFFQQRELPTPQPMPEPTGFDLVRDLLMRKMFELQANPYGMKAGAGNGGFSTGLMPAPAFGNQSGGQGWPSMGGQSWPGAQTSGGGGYRTGSPMGGGMPRQIPQVSGIEGQRPGRVPMQVNRPQGPPMAPQVPGYQLDGHLKMLTSGPRHNDAIPQNLQDLHAHSLRNHGRPGWGSMDLSGILGSRGINYSVDPRTGSPTFSSGGKSYLGQGSSHEGAGWGGQSEFLKSLGFGGQQGGGRYSGELGFLDRIMGELSRRGRRDAYDKNFSSPEQKAALGASGKDIFGNPIKGNKPWTGKPGQGPTISPNTPVPQAPQPSLPDEGGYMPGPQLSPAGPTLKPKPGKGEGSPEFKPPPGYNPGNKLGPDLEKPKPMGPVYKPPQIGPMS